METVVENNKQLLENYYKVPDVTDDTAVWTVDLKSRGHEENFHGDKEKMLPILAKVFKTEKADYIDKITCSGVPMRVDREYDQETQKNYTTWAVCDQFKRPIPDLAYKSSTKVESFLALKEGKIDHLKEDIQKKERELQVLESEAKKDFEQADEILVLKERMRKIEEKINEQESSDIPHSEEPETEADTVMVM